MSMEELDAILSTETKGDGASTSNSGSTLPFFSPYFFYSCELRVGRCGLSHAWFGSHAECVEHLRFFSRVFTRQHVSRHAR